MKCDSLTIETPPIVATSAPAQVAPAEVHVALPIRACFLLFVFAIPFETIDVLGLVQVMTIAKFVGYVLAVLACLQPRACLRTPPAAFWWFGAYLAIYFVRGLPYVEANELPLGVTTVAQNLLLFYIASNVLRHRGMIRWTLATFVVAMALVALLANFGGAAMESPTSGRRTALGQDHNYLGFIYGMAVIAVLGLMAGRWRSWVWALSAVPLLALLGAQWVATGSRGAMLATVVGVAALAVTGRGWTGKAKMLILAAFGVAALGWMVLRSEVAIERWKAIGKGQTGLRVEITQECTDMVLRRPVFGWGANRHLEELASRFPDRFQVLDTHSDLFWALTATGLVGGVPFAIGLFLPLRSAFRNRATPLGPAVLALMVAMLVMGLTVNFHKRKAAWVIMAMACAVGATTAATGPRLPGVPVGSTARASSSGF